MRRLLTKQVNGFTATVEQGGAEFSVRVVGIVAAYENGTPMADTLKLTMRVKDQNVQVVGTTLLGDAAGTVNAGVGLTYRPLTPTNIDPVTGDVTLAASSEDGARVNVPLPDIWFQGDITLTWAGANGAEVTNMLVLYEQSDKFPSLRE